VSQPNLAEQQPQAAPTQKQKTNVYTVMLFLSFVAIVTAIVLLWVELTKWGDYPWWETREAEPKAAAQLVLPVDAFGNWA
jgi:cytoskeletal protein RodZ